MTSVLGGQHSSMPGSLQTAVHPDVLCQLEDHRQVSHNEGKVRHYARSPLALWADHTENKTCRRPCNPMPWTVMAGLRHRDLEH